MSCQHRAPAALLPGKNPAHWIADWFDPTASLGVLVNREKTLVAAGIRTVDHPARSQSVCRRQYPGSRYFNGRCTYWYPSIRKAMSCLLAKTSANMRFQYWYLPLQAAAGPSYKFLWPLPYPPSVEVFGIKCSFHIQKKPLKRHTTPIN